MRAFQQYAIVWVCYLDTKIYLKSKANIHYLCMEQESRYVHSPNIPSCSADVLLGSWYCKILQPADGQSTKRQVSLKSYHIAYFWDFSCLYLSIYITWYCTSTPIIPESHNNMLCPYSFVGGTKHKHDQYNGNCLYLYASYGKPTNSYTLTWPLAVSWLQFTPLGIMHKPIPGLCVVC